MVGDFTTSPLSRHSHRSRHQHFLDDRVSGSQINPIASHEVSTSETFEAVEHISEPVDIDQPARCPPPERCIIRDGLVWREMLAETLRHQSEKKFKGWQEGDAAGRTGIPPRRRIPHSPREKYLFMTRRAPERIVSRIVE